MIDTPEIPPLSRQRAWQIKQQHDGKCIKCGKPLASKALCREHLIQNREHGRKRSGATKEYKCMSRRLEQDRGPHHD
jgi:hypothetical protein